MARVDPRNIDHRTVVFAPAPPEEDENYVPPPPSSGRFLDDSFDFEEAPTRLRPISLAVPPMSQGGQNTVRCQVRDEAIRPPPPSGRSLRLVMPDVDTPVEPMLAIMAFAGYPEVPSSIWGAPLYALHVRSRRKILRLELESAKKRFSPDVDLYERALLLGDARMERIGMFLVALFCAVPVVVALAVLYC